MVTIEDLKLVNTKLRRIMWLSSKDKDRSFNNLMHLFNEESLTACYRELDGKKALGIDGVTKLITVKDFRTTSSNWLLDSRKWDTRQVSLER